MLEVIAESLPFGWGKTASSATDVLQSQKTLESECVRRVCACARAQADSFGHRGKDGLGASLPSHSQRLLHVFVHHIADADGREHLHEVWGDASVKSWHPFFGDYSPKKADHVQLRGPFYRG